MMKNHISPRDLLIRCVAERSGDQWQAFSLEFGLAAQADTLPEVKHKLENMIVSYVYDALVGEDREHAAELLARRAPWQVFLKYHLLNCSGWIGSLRNKWTDARVFSEPVPLQPIGCAV